MARFGYSRASQAAEDRVGHRRTPPTLNSAVPMALPCSQKWRWPDLATSEVVRPRSQESVSSRCCSERPAGRGQAEKYLAAPRPAPRVAVQTAAAWAAASSAVPCGYGSGTGLAHSELATRPGRARLRSPFSGGRRPGTPPRSTRARAWRGRRPRVPVTRAPVRSAQSSLPLRPSRSRLPSRAGLLTCFSTSGRLIRLHT
jgi:hypothetical protein